jgi:hypothetical protein
LLVPLDGRLKGCRRRGPSLDVAHDVGSEKAKSQLHGQALSVGGRLGPRSGVTG